MIGLPRFQTERKLLDGRLFRGWNGFIGIRGIGFLSPEASFDFVHRRRSIVMVILNGCFFLFFALLPDAEAWTTNAEEEGI